jgi:hypothetical protein
VQDPNERFFWQVLTGNIWAFRRRPPPPSAHTRLRLTCAHTVCTAASLVATVHVLLRVLAGRKLMRRLFMGNGSMIVARDEHLVRRVAMRIVW